MVVPDGATHVRRYRFSSGSIKFAIWTLSVFLLLVLSGTVIGSLYLHHNYKKLQENQVLKQHNVQLRNELLMVHQKMAGAQAILDRVQRFDTKLRTITKLHDPGRHLALGPFDVQKPVEITAGQESVMDPVVLAISVQPQKAIGILGKRLDELISEAERREGSVRQLETYLRGQQVRLASTPSIWPTRGWLTSGFGVRKDPYTGKQTMHMGIDIANQEGVPVVATARGVVTFAGKSGGYGNVIVIDHGYGIRTRFGHLSEIAVGVGDHIDRGDRIGRIGNTGRSTGPHLHYEVEINGVAENPMNYILED